MTHLHVGLSTACDHHLTGQINIHYDARILSFSVNQQGHLTNISALFIDSLKDIGAWHGILAVGRRAVWPPRIRSGWPGRVRAGSGIRKMKIKLIYMRYMRAPNEEENTKNVSLPESEAARNFSRYARGGRVGAQTELERRQQREKERK